GYLEQPRDRPPRARRAPWTLVRPSARSRQRRAAHVPRRPHHQRDDRSAGRGAGTRLRPGRARRADARPSAVGVGDRGARRRAPRGAHGASAGDPRGAERRRRRHPAGDARGFAGLGRRCPRRTGSRLPHRPSRRASRPCRTARGEAVLCRVARSSSRRQATHGGGSDMKYLLLIHQGTTPLPGSPEWDRLSEDEQKRVYSDYGAINQTPGVTPGLQLQPPESATTVRVQDGKTLTTDGPFVAVKEALGGWLVYEADDIDAAIELASRIPA